MAPLFDQALFAALIAAAGAAVIKAQVLVKAYSLATARGAFTAADLAIASAIVLAGLVIHELGHVAAAHRGGRRTVEAGLTLAYGCVPAFYVQLAAVPKHASRWERLSVEIGGSGAQLAYAGALSIAAMVVASPGLDAGAAISVILALWQLVPLPGQDGLYALRALRR